MSADSDALKLRSNEDMSMVNRNAVPLALPLRLLMCVLMFCAGATALGQAGSGGVSGLVTDPSGAVVPGAAIVLQNEATGVRQNTVSTAAGLYSFPSVPPGTYRVTATEKGFETLIQDHVVVSVDQTTSVNVTLRLGNVSEVVTVNA